MMRTFSSVKPAAWLLMALVVLLTVFYIWGILRVPFHPDESTQLYTSKDFELLLKDPASMGWDPEKGDDLRQHYRELDAPLTRYLLGFGRMVAGLPALPVDWNWSKTWEENQEAGALPDIQLLYAGRLIITLLLPLSLLLIYLIGDTIEGSSTGLLAAVFLGINTLILLHNRRAMAESVLTLGVLFAMWSFIRGYKYPWLAGIGMALAFNAKQSSIALFPVGLLAVAWLPGEFDRIPRTILKNLLIYLAVFGILTFLLNPVWWTNTPQALQASWTARQELLSRQVRDTVQWMPGNALGAPTQRVVALLANLYFAPPSFAEVGNYLEQTAPVEALYMATPGHNVLRGFVSGGILFILTLVGLLLALLRLRHTTGKRQRGLLLLGLATLCQVAFHLYAVPLSWQRYAIPLVPLTCLWAAYGLSPIIPDKDKQPATTSLP